MLYAKQPLVERDLLQEGLGRGVVVPLVIRQIHGADLVDTLMDIGHELGHTFLCRLCQQIDIGQEPSGHIVQGLLGPLVEPVDAGAVYDGRELARSFSQRATDGREAEDYFEQTAYLLVYSRMSIKITSP